MTKIIMVIALLGAAVSFAAGKTTIEISDAKIRKVPAASTVSAGFMLLKNTTAKDIKLTKVETDISKTVELHEMAMDQGQMKMRPVEAIVIKANSTIELKPGGLHVMFINLVKPLNAGEKKTVTFHFDDGSQQKLEVPVVEMNMMHK